MLFRKVALANGYVVILASSGGDVGVERSEIESLVGRQIDGLVIAPADSRTDSFSDIIPAGVHAVTFDQLLRDVDLDSVTIRPSTVAEAATGVLIGSTRRLHDTIEGEVVDHGDSHWMTSFGQSSPRR